MNAATPNPAVGLSAASTTTVSEPVVSLGPVPGAARPRTVAARVAIVAMLAYQALSIGAVLANPQWNPLTRQLSEYALGRQSWLQIGAFFASALAYAGVLFASRPHIIAVAGRAGRVGLAILAYCVLATIGVGVFVTDPLSTPAAVVSTHGVLHVVFGASALVLLPVAALLLTRSLARTHRHGSSSRRALNRVAFLPLAGFGLIWIPEIVGLIPAGGWPDRILFLTYAAWIIIVTAPRARAVTDQ